MKKITALILTAVLLVGNGNFIQGEEEEVIIYLNDEAVVYNDNYGYPFIDENSRTQVPFRLTLELFGATVEWDDETNIATATKQGIRVEVPLYEQFYFVNGEIMVNDTTPVEINGRIYMPVRAIMEAFGAEVQWDETRWSVAIDYSNYIYIPTAYDLRKMNLISGVKDQGDIGACWAFGSIGAIESTLLPDYEMDLSEDHLSLGHGYDLAQNDGGDYHVAMSYYAGWKGPVLETDDPYGDGVYEADAQAVLRVQEMQVLPAKDFRAIKIGILEHGAVESTVFLDYDVLTGDTEYYNADTHSYYYNGILTANHDVLIVGWDDDYSRENFVATPPIDGAFICKNSYGTEFGDDGYFYVSYGDTNIALLSILYSRIDVESDYQNIYQSDDLGWVGTIGYGDDTAYFGNVYEPVNRREKLEAVSFYTTGVNSSYEIYVVKVFEDMTSLEDMKLIETGYTDYSGYYTVDFDTPILLSESFAVVVKIVTPGAERPVAVEINKNVYWLPDVDISDGYGLISSNGTSWSRTEDLVQANVCLKAFTTVVEQ